jgi:D-amino-acid dehydrogenase
VSLLLAEAGVDRRELEAGEVRAHAPGIDGPIAGGFFTDSDMSGDIHLFTVGLAQWLESTGTVLRLGTRVDGLRPGAEDVRLMLDGEQARFDGVVIAAGVASRALARAAGDRVNVYPVKGYSVTVALEDAASRAAAPEVSLVDDSAKIVTSRLGENRLRIAGTAELNGFNRDIRADRIAPLLDWCGRRFPAVRTERAEPWAGLRPMMPDMMPRMGGGRHPRVFYNTGHGHLGWTLAGATAVAVAGAVTEGMRTQAGRMHPVRAMAQPG